VLSHSVCDDVASTLMLEADLLGFVKITDVVKFEIDVV
jgi:hypothetical protein